MGNYRADHLSSPNKLFTGVFCPYGTRDIQVGILHSLIYSGGNSSNYSAVGISEKPHEMEFYILVKDEKLVELINKHTFHTFIDDYEKCGF
ncbi:hypothetical protein Ddc_14032 [Ditylenchus destructor]|nr:hypothetical protein Ddc_14032 [Ditylenchus destructor]